MQQLAAFVSKQKRLKAEKYYPADVVVIRQFPRNPCVPSMSPFALKLETWFAPKTRTPNFNHSFF
jgi:hypothetical protein